MLDNWFVGRCGIILAEMPGTWSTRASTSCWGDPGLDSGQCKEKARQRRLADREAA